jgi:organic hydroperoxide reductase OsmC/OhrA
MHPFPHHYRIAARGEPTGDIHLNAEGLPTLISAPPRNFGGPGDRWSPEDLLVAAVADCFILSFRAVARAIRMPWSELVVNASGELDRVQAITRFTAVNLDVVLFLAPGVSPVTAREALERAERACLISASLACPVHLLSEVRFVSP